MALEQASNSISLHHCVFPKKCIFIVGQEQLVNLKFINIF